MHTLSALALALALPTDFWHNIANVQPVRIVAVAGSLTALLQIVKTKLPGISGWGAVAINVLMAAAGVITATAATAGPQAILTMTTFGDILVAALAAAGIHGTAKLVNAPTDPNAKQGISLAAVKTTGLLVFAGLALATMTGCNDWERTTFQTLAASQATLDQAQIDYEARTIPKTATTYEAITKAKAVQTLAVQGFATYEKIKAAKGTASALSAQQAIVTASLAQLPTLIAAVQALYKTPSPSAKAIGPATPPVPVSKLTWFDLRTPLAA